MPNGLETARYEIKVRYHNEHEMVTWGPFTTKERAEDIVGTLAAHGDVRCCTITTSFFKQNGMPATADTLGQE